MSKVVFDKEETKNLLNMLKSEDTENQTIAFQALENADLSNYLGELLVLFKFSSVKEDLWSEHAPNAWNILKKHIKDGVVIKLTSGKCLSIMTSQNASRSSIELYMEYFVSDMIGFLGQMGYPADKFNINIELKEDE